MDVIDTERWLEIPTPQQCWEFLTGRRIWRIPAHADAVDAVEPGSPGTSP